MWNPKKRFGLPGLIAVEVEIPIVDCWQSCPEQDAWLEPFGAAVPQAAARIARRAAVTARQALAASSPFTRKWSRKKRRCSAESWKLCGVSTAERTGPSPIGRASCREREGQAV